MQLIITRPAAQAEGWVAELRALGQDAVALPLIDIAPPDDTAALHAAWAQLPRLALVMFVSANAVQHFFAHARHALQAPHASRATHGPDARPAGAWPAGVLAACTGPGTAAVLIDAGVPAGQVVQPAADAASFDSEALWAVLQGQDWARREVLVVRGEEGRDWLAEAWRERGATVSFVAAYRRRAPTPGAEGAALLARALAAPQAHLWVFSSSEAVGHLPALAPGARWAQARALASHSRIAQAARSIGLHQVQLLPAPTPAAVAALASAPWPAAFGAAVDDGAADRILR